MDEMQRRVLGNSAVFARNGEMVGIDFDTLIERLLLFDGYILRTVRFKEIPFLVRGIGYDQTLQLLDSGLIQIRCEVTQIGSEREAELKKLKKPTFSLIWIEAHDWDKYVSDCLADISANLSLSADKWRELRLRIERCVKCVQPSIREEIGLGFVGTIDGSPVVLGESIRLAGRRRRIPIVFPAFETRVERTGDFIHLESDLSRIRIPREELWEIIRDGLMGIATLEQNIGEMKNYKALGGFSPEELPVFEKKMSGLAQLAYPGNAEKRITRVAMLTGLPRFSPEKMQLSVEKLFRARESDDLRSFRDWLATSDGLTDEEVRQMLRGYRTIVTDVVRGGSVTMTRLMVEGIVGVFQPVAGLVLSALDTFLIEKLLPHRGPAAFVNKTYPSLFAKRKRRSGDGRHWPK